MRSKVGVEDIVPAFVQGGAFDSRVRVEGDIHSFADGNGVRVGTNRLAEGWVGGFGGEEGVVDLVAAEGAVGDAVVQIDALLERR